MEIKEKSMKLSSLGDTKKTSSFWRHFFAWLILILFFLKISSIAFIYYFPKSSFFAEISKSLLLTLTNQERKSLGVSVLRENTKLNQAAYLKAKDMLEKDYFAHTSPSGRSPWHWFEKVGYNYRYAGENLAIDFLDSEELFAAWDNSPSHRENIINTNYTDIGIAVVTGEFEGAQTTVVVQLFGSPVPALAKETTTSTQKPKPSTTTVPKPVTTSQIASSGQTLCGYFIKKSGNCPSLKERATLYEKYGLGLSSTYQGTVEQNTALLNALVEGEKTEKPAPKPTVAQKPQEKIEPKVTEKVPLSQTLPQRESSSYKLLDFLSRNYDNIIQNTFLIVLALVIISLSFDFVGKVSVNYGNLFLKGTFYTFVLLVLYSLNKEVLLKFLPRVLKIF